MLTSYMTECVAPLLQLGFYLNTQYLCFIDIYKRKRGEEVKLSENSMEMEKVKQQHSIQEDKVSTLSCERKWD